MIFGRMPLAEAVGAVLGHSVGAGRKRLKKGHVLSAADIAELSAAGMTEVVAGRLEAGDVPEDQAADALAAACGAAGVRRNAAFTGRANLYAGAAGLALIDIDRVNRLNLVHESITIATLPPFEPVEPGQMLATIKVIPFAAPRAALDACLKIAGDGGPLIRVAAFRDRAVGLVMTRLADTKPSILDKTEAAVRERVEHLGGRLAQSLVCPHDDKAVASALAKLVAQGCSPILVFGASAIVDRRDVVPAGVVLAGGRVEHFGMPVDPGNLLLLARMGDVPVIGLPGCARSPKINGFDWVLRRLLADVPVEPRDLMLMGGGGLLKEIPSRPMPRDAAPAPSPRMPRVAAIVLAAGQSSRMGARNKMLADVGGKPMAARAVDAVLASGARPAIVVLGHQADAVRAALAGRDVTFVHNPDYAEGLSTSLRAGLNALPDGCDGAVICLGDMPRIEARHIDKLIAAFNPAEGRAICVPTKDGKRGNPVLWAARFFPEMKKVHGDAGAKHLIGDYDEVVREVPVDDNAVLLDIDTPQALAALTAGS
jgi:molybdenum cofactor cytidylyltransferase